MGRTLPTMIQFIHFEEEQWKAYRRALRLEDRPLFDALWRHVRHFAVSAQMANRPIPFEALMFSMILGVLKELRSPNGALTPALKEGSDATDQRLDL